MYQVRTELFIASQVTATSTSIDSEAHVYKQLHRYNDFTEYHHDLTKQFPHVLLPHLPPKQSSALTERELQARQDLLAQWLHFVLLHPLLQAAPRTELFVNNGVLDWPCGGDSAARTLPVADDFLYETDDEESRRQAKQAAESDAKLLPPVFNKFTESARYKCVREMHTIAR